MNLNCVSIKAKANKNFLDMRKKLPRLDALQKNEKKCAKQQKRLMCIS